MLCTETKSKMAKARFLDELVNFLGDPIFQIPVRSFMDENCLKVKSVFHRLTRLRTGHTKLTHGHLLRGEVAPVCQTCNTPLSVKHLMLCCQATKENRKKFLKNVPTMRSVFHNTGKKEIRDFLMESFDPEVGPTDDHKEIHKNYNQLVNQLLQAFCTDAGVTVEEVIKAFDTMCTQNKELKEYFEVLYDQVMASTDFNIFFGAMAKRNIIIQQQVLVMILAATGSMPSSFSLDEQAKKGGGNPEAVLCSTAADKQEEELLKQVMKASEDEHRKQRDLERQEKEQLKKTLELSKAEAQALHSERKQIEQKLEKMTLEAPPPPPPVLAPVASSSRSKKEPSRGPVKATHPGSAPAPAPAPTSAKPVSGSEAANAWLNSAQEEAAKTSAAHAAVAKNMAKLSPEEIQQRQQFLAAQRDKLMAMKKQKREDQLQDAVKQQPQRPASARAARSAMGGAVTAPKEDDERAMAMRRAIAEKIKQEVIRK